MNRHESVAGGEDKSQSSQSYRSMSQALRPTSTTAAA